MRKWRKKANYIQYRQHSARLKQECENNKGNLAAINRIADALESTKIQEQAEDDKRAFRETATIILLIATVILTFGADFIFYLTLVDSHDNATRQGDKLWSELSMMRENLDQTARALDNSAKQTEAAFIQATAAKEAAEETVDSERARLFILPDTIKRIGEKDRSPVVPYSILNLGRTGALVTGRLVECKYTDVSDKVLAYDERLFGFTLDPVGGGETIDNDPSLICELDRPLTDQELSRLRDKHGAITFIGYIKYQDIFGKKWKKRFGMGSYGGQFFTFTGPGLEIFNSEEEDK